MQETDTRENAADLFLDSVSEFEGTTQDAIWSRGAIFGMVWTPSEYQFGVPNLASKSMENKNLLDDQALRT